MGTLGNLGRRILCLGGLAILAGTTLLAGSPALAATKLSGGTATFAMPTGATNTYIFPLTSASNYSNLDVFDFQYLMWRPLFWFGSPGSPLFNPKLSVGQPPVYSNGGRTVTISLNHYEWSDGTPVTSRDVEFWINLLLAEKANFAGYVPGLFPDNLVSENYSSPTSFSLTFNRAYNHDWLLYNQLSLIIPLPQQSWDRTSASTPVGDYDMTTAGAQSVYNFLNAQSESLTTWTSNPLWKTVDGPWRLSAYSPETGYTALVPNKHYTGPQKPTLAKFEELPFTSENAEFDAILSGQVDYGYVPIQDLTEKHTLAAKGYNVDPWTDWGFTYAAYNYSNPIAGPIFNQLYFRQALQHLVNQPQYIKDIWKGYGYTTNGPVPVRPPTSFASAYEKKIIYPYSISSASKLLSGHGWHVVPDGVDTCQKAGTGSGECGSGIKQGAKLAFSLQYASGVAVVAQEVEALKSSASGAGIQLNLTQAPVQTVFSTFGVCDPSTGADCSWAIKFFSLGPFTWTYSPAYYPSGEELFETGASFNGGGYSNSTVDSLIAASQRDDGLQPLYNYENFIAKEVPALWMPSSYDQFSVVSKKLQGTQPQDPNLNIYPESWYFSR
jgi:peptide/nickel transport system substrate-binding protein